RIFIFGLILFTLASAACALAWSLPSLVVARFFQGVGGAAVMGINTALLREIYPRHMLGRGLGTNALVVAVSFAIGPTLASTILTLWSWPWLFAINLPFGALAIYLACKALPQTARASHKLDALTALYSFCAFGLLILTIGEGAHLSGVRTVLLEACGALIFFVLLLRRQAGHHAPMLPVDLFRLPQFSLSALTAVFTFA